jgi:hypothetical protein
MTPEQELEEVREWLQTQNLNELSFAVQMPVMRLRTFRDMQAIDPSYTTIRKLQLYKDGTTKNND